MDDMTQKIAEAAKHIRIKKCVIEFEGGGRLTGQDITLPELIEQIEGVHEAFQAVASVNFD